MPTVNLQGKGSGGRNQELVYNVIAFLNVRCIVMMDLLFCYSFCICKLQTRVFDDT